MIHYHTHKAIGLLGIRVDASPLFNGLAILIVYLFLIHLSGRLRIDRKHLTRIFGLIIIFGVGIGSRLFYYFGPWNECGCGFWGRLLGFINITSGGMVYIGGFIFAIISVIVYAKISRIELWRYLDALAIGAPLGQFIGRIGCFLNGCCYGIETQIPWAITYTGTTVHPTQIYLSLNGLFIFMIMLYLSRRIRTKGILTGIYLMAYSAARFMIEFYRYYSWKLYGLGPTQYILLITFTAGAIIYAYHMSGKRSHKSNPKNKAGIRRGRQKEQAKH